MKIENLTIGLSLSELLDKIFDDGQEHPLRADWAYYLASKVKELSECNDEQRKEILFLKNIIKEGMINNE